MAAWRRTSSLSFSKCCSRDSFIKTCRAKVRVYDKHVLCHAERAYSVKDNFDDALSLMVRVEEKILPERKSHLGLAELPLFLGLVVLK